VSSERVGTIAVCPNCQAQLGVPARVTPAIGMELECPQCATRFGALPDVLHALPTAIVVQQVGLADHDAHHEHDDADDAVMSGLDFDIPGKPASGDHHLDVTPAVRPVRRRSSPVGTLLGIVLGGAGGLLLAGYALLWMTDPPLDLFRMREWLPVGMLPGAMRPAPDDPAFDDWDVEAESDAVADEAASSPDDVPDASADQQPSEEPLSEDAEAATE
jgi:hypothetical protein